MNGLGRYEEALAAAVRAADHTPKHSTSRRGR